LKEFATVTGDPQAVGAGVPNLVSAAVLSRPLWGKWTPPAHLAHPTPPTLTVYVVGNAAGHQSRVYCILPSGAVL
jgi:hypothetical protein